MELKYIDTLSLGGFNYDNCLRNTALTTADPKAAPKTMKTGTTICGVLFKDGVVMAADTRATGGSIVGDKNCEKIHNLAPNILCCGAGTAADCDHVTEMIKRELELHRLSNHMENRVQMAAHRLCAHAFRYGGHIGTHLIVGGVDVKGGQLIECQNDGNMYSNPYHTTGSGSLAAMAILETEFKENMTREEAIALVVKAIEAGIVHDLGSGSNVDVAVITRGKHELLRNYKHDNFKMYSKPGGYSYAKDKVQVYEEFVHKFNKDDGAAPMQIS